MIVHAVVAHELRDAGPVRRDAVRVLLQRVTGRGKRLRELRGVRARDGDGQRRRAGLLHHGDQTAEAVATTNTPLRSFIVSPASGWPMAPLA